MKIGILGGTFDPVHNGHIALAENAIKGAGLDKVVFVPCNLPPHKDERPRASGEDRYRMLLAAAENEPRFEVSRMELDREGASYSVETLRRFKKAAAPGDEFYFIIGSDSSGELEKWREADELLKLAHFLVAERPGFEIRNLARGIKVIPSSSVDVSSSEVRERFREAKPVSGLIPERVREYIKENNLYTSTAKPGNSK